MAPSDTPGDGQIGLGLTREELFMAMRLAGVQEIPGVDLNWLHRGPDGSPAPEVVPVLEAATGTLMARGLLAPEGDAAAIEAGTARLRVADVLIAIVGACAYAEQTVTLSLSLQGKDGRNHGDAFFIHRLRGLVVIHQPLFGDIHNFRCLTGDVRLGDLASDLFGMDAQPPQDIAPCPLTIQAVDAAYARVQEGLPREAERTLLDAGASQNVTTRLVASIERALLVGRISISRKPASGSGGSIASVVVAPDAVALLEQSSPDDPRVAVSWVGAAGFRAWAQAQLTS